MAFPLGRDEWWLCEEQDCTEPDRASPLETQAWVRWRLQDLRTETGKMWLLQDLARHHIPNIPLHLPHDAFIRKIEQLFISGRLHVHKKRREGGSGKGNEKQDVPFPLADRQPRIASGPAPIVDLPVFSPHLNMSAQAAALVAAAASGTPFCQE
jgi:hypothetical protein